MKKFFSVVAFVICAGILNFSTEKVFAYDVYIATFRDGNLAYLMTETVHGTRGDFYFTVRSVKGRNQFLINYNIWQNNFGHWYFSNSQGFNKEITNSTPVARDLRDYVLSHF